MRLLPYALLGLLAACVAPSVGPEVMVRSDTSINIHATADRRQAVEDMAVEHCARVGLVPRLVRTGVYVTPAGWMGVGDVYRFECQSVAH